MPQPEYSPPRTPFGDIYSWNTPETDRATEDLFHQQMFRQQYLGRQDMQLDGILNRELSKSKSADMPELVNSYQNWKGLRQRVLFDKSVQNDPQKYNQVNQASNAALGDLMSKINQSNQQNQWGQNMISEWKQHPERFASDFGDRSQAFFQTPTSSIGNHPKFGDLGNINSYLTTEPTTNFQPILQKAAGVTKMPITIQRQSPDGLQTWNDTYYHGNNPYDFYSSLVGGIAGSKAPHDFVAKYGYTPEEEQNITQRFNDWKANPQVQKIYGLTGQENFPAGADLSEAGHVAKIKAMEHALLDTPTQPEHSTPVTNLGAKLQFTDDLALNRFKVEEKIRQADALARQTHGSDLVQNRQQVAADAGSALWDNMKTHTVQALDINMKGYKEIPLDTKSKLDISSLYGSDGKKIPISRVTVSPNNTYDIYDNNGNKIEDGLPEQEIKARIIGGLLGKKVAAQSIIPQSPTTKKASSGIKWQ